jgi:predicted dienelactone hydrolase
LLPAKAANYKKASGPCQVETVKYEWHDGRRNRDVPVKIYYPTNASSPAPVIVFSHGLGGTREGYEYLGRHWASHGYVSVHLQHVGSDDAAWKGKLKPMESMRAAAANWRNAADRPQDVTFAIDQILRLAQETEPFIGRLDTNRIGMAGHSFGAYTTLAAVGQRLGPVANRLSDPRIKAAIAMSAPVPTLNAEKAYDLIKVPVYHLTGTRDDSPIGDTKPEQRRFPFDHTTGSNQYLLTFTGGDHMVFSGRSALLANRSKDVVFHSLILMSTTAFWDAYLRGDTTGRQWLDQGGFKAVLGDNGVFESKFPANHVK